MKDLIEALNIFSLYMDDPTDNVTCCSHDTLFVAIDYADISDRDLKRLGELGFSPDGHGGFKSYAHGSC